MDDVREHFAADTIEKEKAVIRRLQAALAPSLIPMERQPSDRAMVDQLTSILSSEGVNNLLAVQPKDQFTELIQRALATVEAGGGDREVIDRLWEFMDDGGLNAALATEDANESPRHLVKLMLEGPYKDAVAKHDKGK
jgi:hypothetical protein